MKKAKFSKGKKNPFRNTKEESFNIIILILEIVKLKLIIRLLELLEK